MMSRHQNIQFFLHSKTNDWLSVVPECRINSSKKEIADQLSDIVLEDDKEIVSYDLVSLYTS